MDNAILTVSQLNRYVAFKFKEDFRLKSKLICGEISNLTYHSKTGIVFFTLKDAQSSVKALMFREYAEKLKFTLEDGMSVVCIASVEVFERDGIYQLYVKDIQPSGEGAQNAAAQLLKTKLTEEGLFDEARKKPIPQYPEKIGVITARGAAALQDILTILERRYPIARVILFPTAVQGDAAATQIGDTLEKADKSGCDVLILARGGGSFENLNCFNTEVVARAVAACGTPIISAVGHETDTTLADFAADLRVPTPSAAAEMATPDKNNLHKMLQSAGVLLYNYTLRGISENERKVSLISSRLSVMSADRKLSDANKELLALEYKLNMLSKGIIAEKSALVEKKSEALAHLNPLSVLLRGYAAVYKDEKIVSSSEQVAVGDDIEIKLGSGQLSAKITGIGE